jgi:hypothetical protein
MWTTCGYLPRKVGVCKNSHYVFAPDIPARKEVAWRRGRKFDPFLGPQDLPSGQLTVCYGKSPFGLGKKNNFDWAIFNSYFDITRGVFAGHAQIPA